MENRVFLKPGSLTKEEMEMMKVHPIIGHDMLSGHKFLKRAIPIPYYHHERWDGSGYPFGLKGKQIPLPARIFAVVDVWDAMTSNRPYREAMTREDVLKYIQGNSGKLFDPDVVKHFIEIMSQKE